MNGSAALLVSEIRSRCGFVRRARGCYLYTEKGVRLTDLYLDGGRAILGWDAGKARTVFKNTLERGITGCYDSGMSKRLESAVRQLLPAEYSLVRWWSKASADDMAEQCNLTRAVHWRPWLEITAARNAEAQDSAAGAAKAELPPQRNGQNRVPALSLPETDFPPVIRLTPPFPWTGAPDIYAFLRPSENDAARIPHSDTLPAPLAAGMARAFADLRHAVLNREESSFALFDSVLTSFFHRKGCWLFPSVPKESYRSFFLHCLDNGIVISPDYDVPSVVPFGANHGDLKRMKKYEPL
ncbi:MAG: hypothetical protein NC041_08070 [Bacteroides sp.]|nr:hypothetical protein [Prevotella sp.]MCM1408360.1 hypothetical protein [Treponema brennaborense]MCM1470409.1 hypothetical protein [Bacteroides sp.]